MTKRLMTMMLTLLIAHISYQLAKERFETGGGIIDVGLQRAKQSLGRVLEAATMLTVEASGGAPLVQE